MRETLAFLDKIYEQILGEHPDFRELSLFYRKMSRFTSVLLAASALAAIYGVFSGNGYAVSLFFIGLLLTALVARYKQGEVQKYNKVATTIQRKAIREIISLFPAADIKYAVDPPSSDLVWESKIFIDSPLVRPFVKVSHLIERTDQKTFRVANVDFGRTESQPFINQGWRSSTLLVMDYPLKSSEHLLLASDAFFYRKTRLNELKKIIHFKRKTLGTKDQWLKDNFVCIGASQEAWTTYTTDEKFMEIIQTVNKIKSIRLKIISVVNSKIAVLLFADPLFKINHKQLGTGSTYFFKIYSEIEYYLERVDRYYETTIDE